MSVPTGSVESPGGQAGRLPRRTLVVSANVGAGHNTAAYSVERAARWLWPGCDPRRIDVLDALGLGAGSVLRWLYVFSIQLTPWLYEFFSGARWAYRWAARSSKRLVGSWSGRRLMGDIEAFEPDLIVSTHPIASAGPHRLRRHRGLDVPVAVRVLDFATRPFWLHRGLDLHIVMHGSCAEAACAGQPGISLRIGPPSVPGAFRPGDRTAARCAVGLRPDSFVALVSSGHFGFGTVLRDRFAARGTPATRFATLGMGR